MGVQLNLGEITDGVDLEDGALDPDQVFVQFLCSTDGSGGEHDPDKDPDERVRAEHAALHGRIFRLDAGAPIPPLDYGCRCAIRYVAKQGSMASRVISETTTETPEESVVDAQREWLDANAKGWQAVAKAAAEAAPQDRMAEAFKVAKSLGMDRDLARMATQASPFPMRAAEALGIGPNSGVGPAAARLARLWQVGDAKAGAELARKYPATYRRLLAEGWQEPPPGVATPTPSPAPSTPAAGAPPPVPEPPPAAAPDPAKIAAEQLDSAGSTLDRLAAEQATAPGPADLAKTYDRMRQMAEVAVASKDPESIAKALADVERMRVEVEAQIAARAARTAEARRAVEIAEVDRTAASIVVPATRETPGIQEGIAAVRSLVSRAVLPDARKITVRAGRAGRAFAKPTVDEVHLPATASARSTAHELGHLLERRPEVRAAAEAFLKRRTAGEEARPLRALTGQRGYAKSEVAKRDGFIDPYVGKIYPGGLTEVVSMGLEYMAEDPIAFRAKDPDHFRFIFKLLRGVLEP